MNYTFCSNFKILNKQSYIIRTDQPISLELKDQKYKKVPKNTWQTKSALKGWTKALIIIARGVPNGSGATDSLNLSITTRKKYVVNKIEDSTSRSGEN